MTLTSGYLLGTLAATMLAAQASAGASAQAPSGASGATKPPITLTGCVTPDASTPGRYTFADSRSGAKYRLSGMDRKDALKRGEFSFGTGARRVTIRGGLVPSPNVAAQGGAMDPARVAVASMPGGPSSGTGNVELAEFQVTRVRPLKGQCP